MNDIQNFICKMPKAELQVNLEGTMEPALKFQLAKRNRIELPFKDYQSLKESYYYPTLESFLEGLYQGCDLLQNEQDFYDLTYRYLKTARLKHNVVYAELSFCPQIHTRRGVSFGTVIEGIRLAQDNARKNHGIRSQIILCFDRSEALHSHMETFEQMLPYREWFVGVGFAGNGKGKPPISYAEVIDRARAEGLKVSIRNNLDETDVLEHIRQCLFEVSIDRISDGVNCLEDESLVQEITRRRMVLAICPISTEDGKTTTIERRQNPRLHREIPVMLEKGLNVCLNSDDPAYFLGHYMNEILITSQQAANLSKEQLLSLMKNAFQGSWLNKQTIDSYINQLHEYAKASGI
jgi:adenine deaminase